MGMHPVPASRARLDPPLPVVQHPSLCVVAQDHHTATQGRPTSLIDSLEWGSFRRETNALSAALWRTEGIVRAKRLRCSGTDFAKLRSSSMADGCDRPRTDVRGFLALRFGTILIGYW